MSPYEPSKMDQPAVLAALLQPRQETRNETPPSCREIEIQVDDEVILGGRFYCGSAEAVNILFFHGYRETVGDYDQFAPLFLEAGLNVCIVGYRGYGWSSGSPSLSALSGDCGIVLDYFVELCNQNSLSSDIFVMGRSLGTGFCIDLAARCPEKMKGIIIDSAFADSLGFIERLGCNVASYGLNEEDCFDTLAKISEIEMPTLILHGTEDQLIEMREAVKLQAESAARTKQLFIIPGADHHSLKARSGATYFETIKRFTDTVTDRNTWRQRRKKFRSQENRR